jgi:hypothetical protein
VVDGPITTYTRSSAAMILKGDAAQIVKISLKFVKLSIEIAKAAIYT